MELLQDQEELDRCGHCASAHGLHYTVSPGTMARPCGSRLLLLFFRYIFGTDKLRPNAFEVRGMDGSSTGEEDFYNSRDA